MRTTILTEQWLPKATARKWLQLTRRPVRSPVESWSSKLGPAQVRDTANDPAQALVDALISCITATIQRRAAAAGIRVRSIEPRVEGEINLARFTGEEADIRRWYRQLKIAVSVDGNADEEALEHIVRTSQHAVLAGVRCGIHWC